MPRPLLPPSACVQGDKPAFAVRGPGALEGGFIRQTTPQRLDLEMHGLMLTTALASPSNGRESVSWPFTFICGQLIFGRHMCAADVSTQRAAGQAHLKSKLRQPIRRLLCPRCECPYTAARLADPVKRAYSTNSPPAAVTRTRD